MSGGGASSHLQSEMGKSAGGINIFIFGRADNIPGFQDVSYGGHYDNSHAGNFSHGLGSAHSEGIGRE
ncbi:MAG: hypothetical protein SFT90_07890 [Rickettsiales bacterium]|nr:hypothetical protein [Rickettsiales bacterium]